MRSRHWSGVPLSLVLSLVALLALPLLAMAPAQARPAERDVLGEYVALGDSYSSAPGVPVTSWARGCQRSDHNYASLLAATLGARVVRDVTCSGAQPIHMVTAQGTRMGPQFDALSPRTDLVTMGIGANHGGIFGGLVYACPSVAHRDPAGHPCQDAARAEGEDAFYALADEAGQAVEDLVGEAQVRAPNARIMVIGYPRLAPESGTCATLPLAAGDYAYVNSVLARLNDGLARAAAAAGETFIDLWGPSLGHDICSADPWVLGNQSVAGVAWAYHPRQVEQEAVAQLVAAALTE